MSDKDKTLGQRIVRIEFAKTDDVSAIKRKFANLIDEIDAMAGDPDDGWLSDKMRSEAITHLEIAAMFTVKLMTA